MSAAIDLSEIFSYFDVHTAPCLRQLPDSVQADLREIRVRAGQPLSLVTGRDMLFLRPSGQPVRYPDKDVCRLNGGQVGELFKSFCGYSVHSCQDEINNGFLTITGGHRIGVCGTTVTEGGRIQGLKEISSLNIRIARQVYGAAEEFYTRVFHGGLCSVLIIGAPATGKTTIIRDLARGISNGRLGGFFKVSIVDERGEIASMFRGVAQNDVGFSTDIYHLCPKAKGMEMALRSGSPDVILCDEIGGEDDAEALLQSMLAGVKVIATAHGDSLTALKRRKQMNRLLECGAFDKVVILQSGSLPGIISRVEGLDELETAMLCH